MALQDQIDKSRRSKRFNLIRISILIFGLLLLAAGATLWFLSYAQKIDSGLSNVLAIIFGVLGALLAFLFWLFPFPSNQFGAEPSGQISSSSNVQQIALKQAQQAQQIQNVQHLQQFFLSPGSITSPQSTSAATASHPGMLETEHVQIRNKRIQESNSSNNAQAALTEKELIENDEEKSLPDPNAIFHFNVPLPDLAEFYGRTSERETLVSRVHKPASTSIIGPRRIGKTWLINYLRLMASQNLGSNFRVGYLDATSPSCATVSGFTSRAVKELGNPVIGSAQVELDTLEQIVDSLRLRNIRPVLCIDEFEGLCNPRFDMSFFTGLRAIEQAGLVLIVASKQPISTLVSDQVKSSPFFNIFDPLFLQPFGAEEAKGFIQDKGRQANFTEKEQSYVLEYGRKDGQSWAPLRIQLVGKMLLEDKNRSVRDNPMYYRPNDPNYWRDFEKRLEEKYKGAVGI